MRHRKHAEEHVNHERWLISYADFITLLFAFFVVLFASAHRDNQAVRSLSRAIRHGFESMGAFSQDKGERISGSSSSAWEATPHEPQIQSTDAADDSLNGTAPIDIAELRRELEAALGKELKSHEVTMQVTPEGFVISLKELGFFDSGQAVLLPGAAQKLERIAKVLSRPGLELRVEGHSDNQPIHTDEFRSNWELSTARAMAVLSLLVDHAGFDPTRISASGYGQYRPTADNSTPEGRRMNRRVDLVVVEARENHAAAH
jgi:chemotaxis protein MotB